MDLDLITTKEFNGRTINFYVKITKEYYSEYYLKSSDVRALFNLRKTDTDKKFYKASDLFKFLNKSPLSDAKKQAVIDFLFDVHFDIRDNYMKYLQAHIKRMEELKKQLEAECAMYESSLEYAIGKAVSDYLHQSPEQILRRLGYYD